MDRNHAPCTLNEELDEETRYAEGTLAFRQDPRGDQKAGYEGGDDDGATAAEELGEIADDGATDAGAGFHEDGGAGGGGVIEVFLREHEGCV